MNRNRNEAKPFKIEGIQICPKCGTKDLIREINANGHVELVCPNLDCDFTYVGPSRLVEKPPENAQFTAHFKTMDDSKLAELAEKLEQSVKTLTGRSLRLVRQQLAIVQSELQSRSKGNTHVREVKPMKSLISEFNQQIPPQFQTPKAAANRIRGIREYYRRRKAGQMKEPLVSDPVNSSELIVNSNGQTKWLDSLLKTLQDEACRHEQVAQNYARVPDLFPLYIEHSARAFEISRIVDLLSNCSRAMFGAESAKV